MRPGDRIADFEICELRGRGSFGSVFHAIDLAAHREVALKLIPLLGMDPEVVAAERKGAEIQRLIAEQCEAVVGVYRMGEAEGYLYVAMELVKGTGLANLLREGALPERRTVAIATQLCRALEVFHGEARDGDGRPLRIVHGDLKPENVLLQDGDRVRLLDFGVAKRLRQERNHTRQLFGTIPYTAPESLDGEAVDLRSDLWAVAVLLYEMVAGRSPFPGNDEVEKRRRLMSGHPPEPLPASVSRGLRLLLAKALAFDPDRRYPSARLLREDLDRLRNGQALEVEMAYHRNPLEGTRRHAETDKRARPRSAGSPPTDRQPRRIRGWRALALILVLTLAGLQIHSCQIGKAIDADLTLGSPEAIDTAVARLPRWACDPLRLLNDPRERLRQYLRKPLTEALEATRTDAVMVDAFWLDILSQLDRLHSLDPSFVASRASFSQGMLDLVVADRHWGNGDSLAARTALGTAISHFREAGKQAPEWAMPHFGLVQALTHPATAAAEREPLAGDLKHARQLSTNLTDRERELLIAGYLILAERAHRHGRAIDEATQRAQQLHQACKDLQDATSLCRELRLSSRHHCDEQIELRRRAIENDLREAGYFGAC